MYFVKTPKYLKRIFSSMEWEMPSEDSSIYLTFDDGPTPEVSTFVLDQLKQYNAKATFFCVGKNIDRYPDLYARMVEEGHATGNHTYNHINGWESEDENYFDDIDQCASLVDSKLFRPPYGRIKISQIEKVSKDYRIIMWDVLSGDWNHRVTPEECLSNVLENTENGSIVVMHDSVKAKERLYHALPAVLDHFSGKGFRFRKIEQ